MIDLFYMKTPIGVGGLSHIDGFVEVEFTVLILQNKRI